MTTPQGRGPDLCCATPPAQPFGQFVTRARAAGQGPTAPIVACYPAFGGPLLTLLVLLACSGAEPAADHAHTGPAAHDHAAGTDPAHDHGAGAAHDHGSHDHGAGGGDHMSAMAAQ